TFNAATGTVKTVGATGGGCSAVVTDGSMFGSKLPMTWDLDLAANVLAAMTAANTGNYAGFNKAVGPIVGDGAVDVVWDLGALGVGHSFALTVPKTSPPPAPDPATFALLGAGLLGVGLLRRRKTR